VRYRSLLATLAGLAAVGGLLVTGAPAGSATAGPTTGTASPASPSRLRAEVTAPVGGDWSVRFVDGRGTVLASVGHDAIALVTAAGRVPADHVLSVSGDTVELGTADPALTATVSVVRRGPRTYAVSVIGHGDGITATSADFQTRPTEHFLGLGERSDAVDHRGDQVQDRVLDGPYTDKQAFVGAFVPTAGFSTRADATYFPVPWILSTAGYGVLVDDDEDSSFELATPDHPDVTRVVVQAPHLDLRLFDGPTPAEALGRMTKAVGRQPYPTDPTIYGAWWQPAGADAAAELADQRRRGVPVSVAQTYTHFLPCGAQDDAQERANTSALHRLGVAVTTYVNPMVCTSYQPVYDQGVADGAFTRNPDGTPLVYHYSTASNFEVSQIDFTSQAGRNLFQKLLQGAVDDGYDGWMEDFGEYTPDTAVSADGTPGPAMHNAYVDGYHATALDYEVRLAPRPLLRFNRSGWTGAIPYSSIVWGGDATTVWGFDGLASSVRQGLTMGTSGVSVWGPDIGGFFTGPGEPQLTPELLDRWIEYGAFTGVMRLQTGGITLGTSAKRPQVTAPRVAPVWKRYARLRTMLYPYVAGSQDAYEHTGLPLMRDLALVYPEDARAVRADDEYLFGSDLLVAPVITPGISSRRVYLPHGRWIELARSSHLTDAGRLTLGHATVLRGGRSVTALAPRNTIPLFVRAGAVLPMLPRSVDTLSSYGRGVRHLGADRRTLLAAPAPGRSTQVLGSGETLASRVSGRTWTLRLSALTARRYDVQATLAALGRGWTPCRVVADGSRVPFGYDAAKRVLTFRARVAAGGAVRVTACR